MPQWLSGSPPHPDETFNLIPILLFWKFSGDMIGDKEKYTAVFD
jgi:hypothetical protein